MSTLPGIHASLLLVFALLLTAAPSLQAGGSSYVADQLNIKGIEPQKDGRLQITFSAPPESMYYCAGANGKVTDEGLELTFVRSHFKKTPKVDYPARLAKKTDGANDAGISKTIKVPRRHGAVFLRDGKKLVKLSPEKGAR